MSKASATGQITVISNGTTYNALLQSDIGDIVQSYEGTSDSPVKVSPDFSESGTKKPTIMLMLFSAERGNGNALSNVSNDNVKWFINENVQLNFDSNGLSTNSFGGASGHFKKTTYIVSGSNNSSIEVPAIKIQKNLVAINDGSSFTIKAQCVAPVLNSSVELSATYQVIITTAADVTKKVSIAAADSHPFTILEKKGACRVVALIDGVETNDSSYKYAWSLFRNGKWEDRTDGNGNSNVSGKPNYLDVFETEVDSHGLVKVVVSKNGAVYGSDIANISDSSDPYLIYPNPKEVIRNASGIDTDDAPDNYNKGTAAAEVFTVGDGRTIRYKPILKPESANPNQQQKYVMYMYDFNGNDILSFTEPAKHFDVNCEDVAAYGGSIYIIQTSD